MSKRTSGDTASALYIEVPSYTLIDAVVSAEYKDWELRVNAVNLLDEFYYSSCSQFGSCQYGDDQLFNAIHNSVYREAHSWASLFRL